MATQTDPAAELASIADRLAKAGDAKGARFLAEHFGVEAWSTDFMRIIACILERADLVGAIIDRSAMDPEHKAAALEDLQMFKGAFTSGALMTAWNNTGGGLSLVRTHGHPIKYMSSTVRPVASYPKLDDTEIRELVNLIDQYLADLTDDGDEPAFVREAIRDGLRAFRFQLTHFQWMGAGYALSAFRDVVAIYDALQRQFPASTEWDAEATWTGLGRIVSAFSSYAKTAKGWADTVGLVWKGYQLTSTAFTTALIANGLNG